MTREEVSEQTGINSATLYRIETARVRPQRRTLVALLDKYGVTDEDRRDELIDLSKQATQLGWLQAYESELPEEYTAYISFENEALGVRNYESLFVPGLLQVESYARAVIAGAVPIADEDYVERRVEARLNRQASLRKTDPLKLWAIVDEAVLHRLVGGPKVMAEQLDALATAKQPHVVVQVVPFGVGAHPGMPGSFAIMDFPDPADPDLVYIDSMAGDLFLEREPDIKRFAVIFEHLRAAALNPVDSARLIREVASKMK
ncbi:helix-turn-helix domain-containing protein [Micromonospora sp. NPDC004704]